MNTYMKLQELEQRIQVLELEVAELKDSTVKVSDLKFGDTNPNGAGGDNVGIEFFPAGVVQPMDVKVYEAQLDLLSGEESEQ